MTASPSAAGGRALGLLYRVTVPGVVLHELSHQFVAELLGLEVREVDYTSHVVHEAPRTILQALLVGVAPLVVNTAFAAGTLWWVVGGLPVEVATVEPTWQIGGAGFLAFAFLFRAVPSTRDIANIFSTTRRRFRWYRLDVLAVFLLLSPVVVPLYVGLRLANATGTRVVVDAGYAALGAAVLTGVVVPAELL